MTEDRGLSGGRVAVAQRGMAEFELPGWLRTVGTGAWFTLGILGLLAVALLGVALVAEVAIPLAIAAVLAAILVPLTDRLERWRVPRWLGATLVLLLGIVVVAAVIALVVRGIASESDEIWSQLESSLGQVDENVESTVDGDSDLAAIAHDLVSVLTTGLLGSLVSSVTGLVVGFVLALFMLLFLLKDWEQITGWTAGHLGLPEPLGNEVLDGTVGAFRGYAAGLTLIGAANAVVVGLGAALVGVPLAGTIAVVAFVTSYVPYLGAFVTGAFAVLIAYGAGGLGDALIMLAIVLLANNTIQNVIEPFAFGTRLRLHPLAVLLTVTTATMLFGVMGAILAAPLASATLNAFRLIGDAGLLGPAPADPESTQQPEPTT